MNVRFETRGPVAILTIDRPDALNALSIEALRELRAHLIEVRDRGDLRVAVLTGEGTRAFCAGADLSEAAGRDPGDIAVDRAQEMTRLLRAILAAPVPVIAAVDGHVRAGGMGLVGACDIAVAGPQSTFALTEARIGVAPSIISLTLLPKLTARAAGRYFLTGEKFGPQEAADIGLITVAADDLAGTVTDLTTDIAKASPQGLAASKALTTAGILAGFDAHADALTAQSAELFTSAEAREGMLAFLQKRQPDWA